MPHKAEFFDFFEQHAAITLAAAEKYLAYISHAYSLSKLSTIKEMEHQADRVTRNCIEALHKTFITPIDRDQIHSLINAMDDIMDSIDAAADELVIYKIQHVTKEFISLAEILVQSMRQVQIGVKGLRRLTEKETINRVHQEVYRLEHEADVVLRSALGRLFDEEADARQIIKWKDLYQTLENATDQCATVTDVLEGILLENY